MARKNDVPASGSSIVVIDDNLELLASTVRLLRRDGHEVTAFDDPEGALEALKNGAHPDLVLVDYCMPKMTGDTFVTELRRFEPRMQVVL